MFKAYSLLHVARWSLIYVQTLLELKNLIWSKIIRLLHMYSGIKAQLRLN
jgi:hypothetical protein